MRTRVIWLLLFAALVLSVSACGKKNEKNEEDTTVTATEKEIPSGIAGQKAPEEGAYLYQELADSHMQNLDNELPEAIYIRIDQGGAESIADIRQIGKIRKLTEAFLKIKVGPETFMVVTDNYNGVQFTFSDGSVYSLSLNLKTLEISADNALHYYELEDFDDFWKLMVSYTKSEGAMSEDDDYQEAVCKEQAFSTYCLSDYSVSWDDEDGLYIFADEPGSIPYVLIWRMPEMPVSAEQYLEEVICPDMEESYGDALIDESDIEYYEIDGEDIPGVLFTYLVDSYTVESLRLVAAYGDDLVNFTAKYLEDEGDETLEALELAIENFSIDDEAEASKDGQKTNGKGSSNNKGKGNNRGNSKKAGTEVRDDILVIPSEYTDIAYEEYSDPSGCFTMEIPAGWKVKIGLPPEYAVDYISYALTVYDPSNPDRKLYFNLNCGGFLKSEAAREWYEVAYPGTFGALPAVTSLTSEGYFGAVGEYFGYEDFTVIENIGQTPFGGDLLNASVVSLESGDTLQGLFTATVTAMDNYVHGAGGMIDVGYVSVYTVIYETAPMAEFMGWQPVLDHCLSSLEFTKNFMAQREAEWRQVLATSTYIFNTANEISDMIMDSWEQRNLSYDVISQKQSDAILGYERILDTETGEYYLAEVGLSDGLDDGRYEKAENDDAYLNPIAGWIEWK